MTPGRLQSTAIYSDNARSKYLIFFLCAALLPKLIGQGTWVNDTIAAGKTQAVDWKGTLKDGTVLTVDDLAKILAAHQLWDKTFRTQGKKADLSGANLIGAELKGANLIWADLSGAKLKGAHLDGADLIRAELKEADLSDAKLDGAHLDGADLSSANLERAHLNRATLSRATLGLADLNNADLNGADLTWATLDRTQMMGTNLGGAKLLRTDFTGANMMGADLGRANIDRSNLSGAIFWDANLEEAVFEPEPGKLPKAQDFAGANAIATMKYNSFPTGLVELRAAFKEAGLEDQAREVNFAIMHTRRIRANIFDKIPLLAVELPCAYGLKPYRPIKILFGAILIFWIPYFFALRGSSAAGIWLVWPKDRDLKEPLTEKNVRLVLHGTSRLGWALYFSVVSAFNIGWEEINIGSWIARLQPKEFNLKASGWVRVVAGVQSLLGVYLVVLSILSYFGHSLERN